jgi:polyferredoxin
VEAYCPFGGLESLYQFLTTGGFLRRIEPSAMVLFAALVLLTLIANRGFCGWICPFGSVQEWLGLLGKKLLGKKFILRARGTGGCVISSTPCSPPSSR